MVCSFIIRDDALLVFVITSQHPMRPLQNVPFCPISVPALWNAKPIPLGSDSDFNPRNTYSISAVKIFIFPELEQN